MSIQSLESERQAILQRMQMSRSGYRHLLMDDDAVQHARPAAHFADQPGYAERSTTASTAMTPATLPPHEDRFPRSVTMRLIMRHPVALTVGLAALVLIGPRRVVHVATRSGARVTEVTRRNRNSINAVARVMKLALPYVPAAAQYLQTMRTAQRRQGRP